MFKLDIEIISHHKEESWVKINDKDPNFPDKRYKDKWLREPFRSDSLEILKTIKDRFKKVDSTDFGIASSEWDDHRTIILLNGFSDSQELNELAELVVELLRLSSGTEQIELTFNTCRKESFYLNQLPELYSKFDGKIPLEELLKTSFSNGTRSALNFMKNIIITKLNEMGFNKIDTSNREDRMFIHN